jgi:hypothetical protein
VNGSKLLFRPIGFLAGIGAGALAGLVFREAWRLAAGDDDAPDAMDEERGWVEILAAAALQGAIFALVKAAVDRASAEGVRRVTGKWPG